MSETAAEPRLSTRSSRSRVVAGVVATLVVFVDQVSKWWVLNSIGNDGERNLFGSVRLIVRFNRGMAFSLGNSRAGTAWIVSLAIVGLVTWVWVTSRDATSSRSALLGLILGGALGNQVDRWFRDGGWNRGGVVDFVDVGFWPVFNVADAALSCGCVAFVAWTLLFDRPPVTPKVTHSSMDLTVSRHGDEQNGTS